MYIMYFTVFNSLNNCEMGGAIYNTHSTDVTEEGDIIEHVLNCWSWDEASIEDQFVKLWN